MAEEVKALRLAKAASTYNVSLEHIVETLKKAKHEVDNKPTTKLTPEQIAILDKEFGSDKAIKQAADTANKKEEVTTPVV